MAEKIITLEKIENRIKKVFKRVELSQPGETSQGFVDFEVRHYTNIGEVEARASVQGFEFAKVIKQVNENGPGETLSMSLIGYRPGCGEAYVMARRRSLGEEFKVTFNETNSVGGSFGGKVEDFEHPIHRGSLKSIADLLKIK